MPTVATLPRITVTERSNDHLESLCATLDADVFVVPNDPGDQAATRLRSLADSPVVAPAAHEDPLEIVADGHTVLVLPSASAARQAAAQAPTFDRPLVVITSLLSSSYDTLEFSTIIEGTDPLGTALETFTAPSTALLTTQLATGETLRHEDLPVPALGIRWADDGDASQTRYVGRVSVTGDASVPTDFLETTHSGAPGTSKDSLATAVHIDRVSTDSVGLMALRDVGYSTATELRRAGYPTPAALAEADLDNIAALDGFGPRRTAQIVARARALTDQHPVLVEPIPEDLSSAIYLDIETTGRNPDTTLIWQLGAYDAARDEYAAFIRTDPSTPEDIVVQQFLEWVRLRRGVDDQASAGPPQGLAAFAAGNDPADSPDSADAVDGESTAQDGGDTASPTLVAYNGHAFDFRAIGATIDDAELSAIWSACEHVDLLTDVLQPQVGLPVQSWSLEAVLEGAEVTETLPSVPGGGPLAADIYQQFQQGAVTPDWDTWRAYCKRDVLGQVRLVNRLQAVDEMVTPAMVRAARSDPSESGTDRKPQAPGTPSHRVGTEPGADDASGVGAGSELASSQTDGRLSIEPTESARDGAAVPDRKDSDGAETTASTRDTSSTQHTLGDTTEDASSGPTADSASGTEGEGVTAGESRSSDDPFVAVGVSDTSAASPVDPDAVFRAAQADDGSPAGDWSVGDGLLAGLPSEGGVQESATGDTPTSAGDPPAFEEPSDPFTQPVPREPTESAEGDADE